MKRKHLYVKLFVLFVIPTLLSRAETIFFEDFESHFDGFSLPNFNGWQAAGSANIPVTKGVSLLSGKVANGFEGRNNEQTGINRIDLSEEARYTFTFDGYAHSKAIPELPKTHNVNIGLGTGPSALILHWGAEHFNPDVPRWRFVVADNAGQNFPQIPFDRKVRLGIVMDKTTHTAWGTAQFLDHVGNPVFLETERYSVNPEVLNSLDRIVMYQDFRAVNNYVGAQFDDLKIDKEITTDLLVHPADLNLDFKLSIDEVTAYGAAWAKGLHWNNDPNPISVNFVTRAGFLWKKGERYQYDIQAGEPPLCWVLP